VNGLTRYGIILKPNSKTAESIAIKAIDLLRSHGIEPLVEVESMKSSVLLKNYETFELEKDSVERLIVIGGDGTLLRAAMRKKSESCIFMTIRAGKRGFMLDVEENELKERINDFIRGNYYLVEYPRLLPIFNGEEKKCAMNDIAIFTADGELVKATVSYNDDKIYNVDGDGVVISTTIGSTAYSLSAGGPIIDPRLNVIVITPLNPIQLHLRPVVIPLKGLISIEFKEDSGEYYINIDGQEKIRSKSKSLLKVTPCKHTVKIARFRWWEDYYERLFNRLLIYW